MGRRATILVACASVALAAGCQREGEQKDAAPDASVDRAALAPSRLAGMKGFQSAEQLEAFLEQIRKLPAAEQEALLSALRFNAFIVGGRPVAIADHPWQVALLDAGSSAPSQFCGGSLVAPDAVVTAAHCIDNWFVAGDPAKVDVLVGTKDLSSGGERLKVRSVAVHPNWNGRTNDYDVAVLRLATPAAQGQSVPIDPAPIATLPKAGTWVTGWGVTSEGGSASDELLGAEVPVVTNEVCRRPESYGNGITDRMLCAGEREGGVDSCQGDSGGPLTHRGRLIGIVSWGIGCARRLKYGVYTRVSSVAPWIQQQVGP